MHDNKITKQEQSYTNKTRYFMYYFHSSIKVHALYAVH